MLFVFRNLGVRFYSDKIMLYVRCISRDGDDGACTDEYGVIRSIISSASLPFNEMQIDVLKQENEFVVQRMVVETLTQKATNIATVVRLNNARRSTSRELLRIADDQIDAEPRNKLLKQSNKQYRKICSVCPNYVFTTIVDQCSLNADRECQTIYLRCCWILRSQCPAFYARMLCFSQRKDLMEMFRFATRCHLHGRKSFFSHGDEEQSYQINLPSSDYIYVAWAMLSLFTLCDMVSHRNASLAMDKVAEEYNQAPLPILSFDGSVRPELVQLRLPCGYSVAP